MRIVPVDSFRTLEGVDLGSGSVVPLDPPRVAVLASLDPSFGEMRFFLERELEIPFTIVDPENTRADLRDFNLLVLPSGVRDLDDWKESVRQFGQRGGTVVAMGGSASCLTRERSGLTAATQSRPEDKDKDEDEDEDEDDEGWRTQADRQRASRLDALPGSLFEVQLDPEHRLAFGLPERIPVLLTGSSMFRAGGGRAVGQVATDRMLSGYASTERREDVEGGYWVVEASLGRGRAVLFSERPTYRMGFHGAMRALMNAFVIPRS